MGWENKVVWGEGLFLQPQHLQQQERYFERLVRTSTGGLRPFAWGLTQLELDSDLLTLGKFAGRSAAGILPGGHAVRPAGLCRPAAAARPRGNGTQQHRLSAAADSPGWWRGDGTAG